MQRSFSDSAERLGCASFVCALYSQMRVAVITRGRPQSDIGIPGTIAPKDESTAFATWFRVHTLALTAEILTDEPATSSRAFGFTRHLSMGWHKPWEKAQHQLGFADRLREIPTVMERNAHVRTSKAIALGKRGVHYMTRRLKDRSSGQHQ